jgi:hypothetical protein
MVKVLTILLVIVVLMEDSASIKKSADEVKEDEEVQRAVNATLAAEEEKRRKEDEDEAKRKKEEDRKKREKQDQIKKEKDRDEAGLCPAADPCPEVGQCPPCEICPEIRPCQPCRKCPDPVECGPCQECPPIECGPCPPIHCQPCPGTNTTRSHQECPDQPACPEASAGGMSIPVAMAVGAAATLLVTGVATTIGLLLRYTSPIESGFIFLAALIFMWYLSSHHPEVARELGGRAVAVLREATAALSHRITEAIRHHQEQVGLSI